MPSLTESGNADCRIVEAWVIRPNANGIIVGVIDSGIDPTHEDLQGVVIAGIYVNTRDGITNSNYADFEQHGTEVASIIAATKNNSKGIAGVASGCKLVIFKTLLAFPELAANHVSQGIRWCVDNGARVVNLSWGETAIADANLYAAMVYARNAGVVVVSAVAYNQNLDSTPTFPYGWNFNNYIAVTATTRTDTVLAPHSIGSKVVGAPGRVIVAGAPGNRYVYDSGSSFSAPIVTGVIALQMANRPWTTSAAKFVTALRWSAAQHPVANIAGRVDAVDAIKTYWEVYN